MNLTHYLLLVLFVAVLYPSTAAPLSPDIAGGSWESLSDPNYLSSPLLSPLYDDEYQQRYLVIADSSQDYGALRQKAIDLAQRLQLKYDEMDRIYSNEKGLHLPVDYKEDEMWAGEYFLRRDGEDFISLEMRHAYRKKGNSSDGTMIIVAGIFSNKRTANVMLKRVRKTSPKAHIQKATIYMACMH